MLGSTAPGAVGAGGRRALPRIGSTTGTRWIWPRNAIAPLGVVPPTPTELGNVVVVVVVVANVVDVTTVVVGAPLLPTHPARATEDTTAPTPSNDARPIDHP